MRITIVALGSRGDVHPLIALGAGLKQAGYRVRLAAHVLFRQDVEERGLVFSPIPALYRQVLGRDPHTQCLKTDLDPVKFMTLGQQPLAPVMDRVLEGIRRACMQSDLILYNLLALPACSFAARMNVPAWPVCLQPLARTRVFQSPLLSTRFPVPGLLKLFSHVIAENSLVRFFKKNSRLNGCLGFRNYFRELCKAGIPILNGFSPSLVPKPKDWGDNLHVTGFWFLDPPASWQPPLALKDFLDAGEPPVCVGFGSMEDPDTQDIIQCAVDALRRAGRRALVLSGWSRSRSHRICERDDQVFITEDVPHTWLFPRVRAVIHHGGAGTTAAAIRAHVPSIIIPFFFDQWFWADRLNRIGAGPKPLPKRALTFNALESRLETVLAPRNPAALRMKRQLSALGTRINREDGVAAAVDLVRGY